MHHVYANPRHRRNQPIILVNPREGEPHGRNE